MRRILLLNIALSLSTDYLSSSSPSSRIKKCGGFITWNSLGQPNVNGRLAMTRSIGDFDLKKTGVIAEPETKRILVSFLKFIKVCYSRIIFIICALGVIDQFIQDF